MRYLSVCSGIEAATVAWHPLGWEPVAFSEIEPFPSAVLAHHYPNVHNLGDMTKFKDWNINAIDLLVGGTPCQSFSIAGLRKGLGDQRGNLMLTFGAIAAKYRPTWMVWENVPGVLSSDYGRDFASFLGLITGQSIKVPREGWGNSGIIHGYKNAYGAAYRIIDAQYFGVPQRRRRVFVVGYLGDWRRAAAVLFERHSMSGNPAPRRQAGEVVAPTLDVRAGRSGETSFATSGGLVPEVTGTMGSRSTAGGSFGGDFETTGGLIPSLARCVTTGEHTRQDYETCTFLPCSFGWQNSPSQTMSVSDVAQTLDKSKGVAVAYSVRTANTSSNGWGIQEEVTHTLDQAQGLAIAAFKGGQGSKAGGIGYDENLSPTLSSADSGSNRAPALMQGMQVRRLMPVECERLQGFADNYTFIPTWNGWRKMDVDETPEQCIEEGLEVRQNKKTGKWRVKDVDGPRYRALGNSMAVPCMRWIGERIAMVDAIP